MLSLRRLGGSTLYPAGIARNLTPPADFPTPQSYHPARQKTHLSLPPITELPAPAYNRVNWPLWGLGRYAVGHVLLPADDLTLLEAEGGYAQLVELLYTDDPTNVSEVPRVYQMHLLDRRPVSDTRAPVNVDPAASTDTVYLTTVVCPRYRWGMRVYNTTGSAAPASWGDLLSDLINVATGQTISASTINALHTGYPGPTTIWSGDNMRGQQASLLADAAAAAINLRIVVDPATSTVSVQNATTAGTAASSWRATWQDDMLLGGLYHTDAQLPQTFRGVFYDGAGGIGSVQSAAGGGPTGTGEVSVWLPTGSADATHLTRFVTDIRAYWALGTYDAAFGGYPAFPLVSAWGVWQLDHDAGVSRIVSDPIRYPAPLAGNKSASGAGGSEWDTYRVLSRTAAVKPPAGPPNTPPIYKLRKIELVQDSDNVTAGDQTGWRDVFPYVEHDAVRMPSKVHDEAWNTELAAKILVGQSVLARPSPTLSPYWEFTPWGSLNRVVLKVYAGSCSQCVTVGDARVIRTKSAYRNLAVVGNGLRVFWVPPATGEQNVDDDTAGQFEPPNDVGVMT